MTAGRLIRQQARDDRAWQTLCDCGHTVMIHRELSPTLLLLIDGQIVETDNPEYHPLHFHCDNCDCVTEATR